MDPSGKPASKSIFYKVYLFRVLSFAVAAQRKLRGHGELQTSGTAHTSPAVTKKINC